MPMSSPLTRESSRDYVDGEIHTNGVENVSSLFKRGIMGVCHKLSAKYLRYI
jgi:hypothetical protein